MPDSPGPQQRDHWAVSCVNKAFYAAYEREDLWELLVNYESACSFGARLKN